MLLSRASGRLAVGLIMTSRGAASTAAAVATSTPAPPPPAPVESSPPAAVAVAAADAADITAVASPSAVVPKPWSARERRTGLLAVKVGMMGHFDSWGRRHPATALLVKDNVVVRVLTKANEGYNGVVVAAQLAKPKHVRKPELGLYAKAGVEPRRKMAKFDTSEAGLIPVGTVLTAGHFLPGQYVDVIGVTKGKGFAGPMKRWGFRGMPASHGVSVSHRAHGSTSSHQDPGRVWKGKKMAGRMGSAKQTSQSLKVLRIDHGLNVVLVRGSVAGAALGLVRIVDAKMRKFPVPPPFPTFVPSPSDPVYVDADPGPDDPFANYGT